MYDSYMLKRYELAKIYTPDGRTAMAFERLAGPGADHEQAAQDELGGSRRDAGVGWLLFRRLRPGPPRRIARAHPARERQGLRPCVGSREPWDLYAEDPKGRAERPPREGQENPECPVAQDERLPRVKVPK